MNDKVSSLGTYLKIIGICYYANIIKKRTEKETQILTTHKTLMKTHNVEQTYQLLGYNIYRLVSFWNTWNWMGPLSGEKKLQVDEKNKKLKKIEKYLKNNISKTLRVFATNWIHWEKLFIQSSIRSLWDFAAFYDHKKFKKNRSQKQQSKQNQREKSIERKTVYFWLFFKHKGEVFLK